MEGSVAVKATCPSIRNSPLVIALFKSAEAPEKGNIKLNVVLFFPEELAAEDCNHFSNPFSDDSPLICCPLASVSLIKIYDFCENPKIGISNRTKMIVFMAWLF